MIPDDVRPILVQLLERSRKREVEWSSTSVMSRRHGDYVVLFANSSLVIKDDDDGRIEGRILNSRGDIALTFYASYRDADDHDYDLLFELVDLARRKVLGADESLAEIRRAIETQVRVGEIPQEKPRTVVEDDDEVPF